MYSRPSPTDISFFFVSGPDAKPLPVKIESGISVSQVGKKYRYHKLELIRAEEKKGRLYEQMTPENLTEIESKAAIETLKFVRAQSLKRRPGSDLTGELRLMQVKLLFTGKDYGEENKVLATLPPAS